MPGDVLLPLDGREVRDRQRRRRDALDGAATAQLIYVRRCSGRRTRAPVTVTLQLLPLVAHGPLLLDRARRHPGDRRRRVGAAAAAERSGDAAFLLADGGVLRRARRSRRAAATTGSTTSSTGPTWSRGWCCRRCSCTSRSCFPSGRTPWVRTTRRPRVLPLLYAAGAAARRRRASLVMAGVIAARRPSRGARADRDWSPTSIWRCACSGGSAVMMRALTRLRSVTARRQLRWIVWGSSVGAVPFVALYVVPLLLGQRAAVRASTPPCCSAAFRSRSRRPSSATG